MSHSPATGAGTPPIPPTTQQASSMYTVAYLGKTTRHRSARCAHRAATLHSGTSAPVDPSHAAQVLWEDRAITLHHLAAQAWAEQEGHKRPHLIREERRCGIVIPL